MARQWQVIRVELLGGLGVDLDAPPGRLMVCPPSTTFAALADAIDTAFARWDRAHLSMFTLADGTEVVDEEMAEESESEPWGAITKTAPLLAKVASRLEVGDRFTYVFDLGDEWRHACEVVELADPDEVLGIVPSAPLPMFGWGAIPDQHGRRWQDDDGEGEPPEREVWELPGPGAEQPLDMQAWRAATHARSVERMREALLGADPTPVLQRVGAQLLSVLHEQGAAAGPLEPIAVSILQRLRMRGWIGDALLADDLLAMVRSSGSDDAGSDDAGSEGTEPDGAPSAATALDGTVLDGTALDGKALVVDLDSLVDDAATYGEYAGGYLNIRTGESVPAFLAEGDDVAEDDRVDVDSEEWLYLSLEHPDWRDMAAFAASRAGRERDALERALEGKGAYSRFRGAVDALDLWGEWQARADELRWGELRELLRERGIVPV